MLVGTYMVPGFSNVQKDVKGTIYFSTSYSKESALLFYNQHGQILIRLTVARITITLSAIRKNNTTYTTYFSFYLRTKYLIFHRIMSFSSPCVARSPWAKTSTFVNCFFFSKRRRRSRHWYAVIIQAGIILMCDNICLFSYQCYCAC